MKKIVVSAISLALSAMLATMPTAAKLGAQTGNDVSGLYTLEACIVKIDKQTDLVTVETGSGLLYQFRGNDFKTGNIVSLLMNSNGTPVDITNNIIVNAH